jgi:hypothetical protein
MINGDDELALEYAEIFNCNAGQFPIKYLGVPISPSRLKVVEWTTVKEKNKKRLDIWKGGYIHCKKNHPDQLKLN